MALSSSASKGIGVEAPRLYRVNVKRERCVCYTSGLSGRVPGADDETADTVAVIGDACDVSPRVRRVGRMNPDARAMHTVLGRLAGCPFLRAARIIQHEQVGS